MKLLPDANLSWRLVSILNSHFDQCVRMDDIPELGFPAKDAKIWQYAKDHGFVIITRDSDFSNFTVMKGFPPKIVLLKTGNCNRNFTADFLIRSKQMIQQFVMSQEDGLLEIF
jgi:predicted nuclease of predicted toxin-antitoxin system